MKWKLNKRTMQMEPHKETGIRVSARQGGIMVEDFDKHIQFLINYPDNRITHCVGIQPTNLHVFDIQKSRQIADRVMRLGAGRNIDKTYFDWKTYSINNRNDMKVLKFNEFNKTNESYTNDYDPVKDGFVAGEWHGEDAIVVYMDDDEYTFLVGPYTEEDAVEYIENGDTPENHDKYGDDVVTCSVEEWREQQTY